MKKITLSLLITILNLVSVFSQNLFLSHHTNEKSVMQYTNNFPINNLSTMTNIDEYNTAIVQIANQCDRPIGINNIFDTLEKSIGITLNELGSTVTSFRIGSQKIYGIVGLGYNYRAVSKESFIVELGLGTHINISPVFRINTELKGNYFSLFSARKTGQAGINIMPAYKITPSFEVFGGPSINYLGSSNIKNRNLFPEFKLNLWKKFEKIRSQQVYVGLSIGCHYIF